MKKVFVTGAAGFIGSHLTEMLVQAGYDVKAFVFYNSFNNWGWLDTFPSEILSKIDVFAGDIRDPNGVREAMRGVDTVFHLAALIAIPFSYHSPDSYVDTNIKGTLNVYRQLVNLVPVEYWLHRHQRYMGLQNMFLLMKIILFKVNHLTLLQK